MADVDIQLSPSVASSLSSEPLSIQKDDTNDSGSELTAHDTLQLEDSDDENVKLKLSDDENEDIEEPVVKKRSRNLKIVDSDSEIEMEKDKVEPKTNTEVSDEDKEEPTNNSNNNKSKIFDSDNEPEKDKNPDFSDKNKPANIKKKSRISKVIDSDTENEIPNQEEVVKNIEESFKNAKFSALIDSDSITDLSDQETPKQVTKKKVKKISKKNSKKEKKNKTNNDNGEGILASLNLDFGSDSDKSITDNEEGSENSEPDEVDMEMVKKGKKALKQGSEKKERMSAKVAKEQMKVIQSESQRMAREAEIRVPYHRPKQYSLKEFLNRKTINKPVVTPLNGFKQVSIKMTQEELEEYAKKLEERAKEAHKFYRNEESTSEKSKDEEIKETNSTEKNETLPSQMAETEKESPKTFETEILPLEPMDTNPCDTLHVTESDVNLPIDPSVNSIDSDLSEFLKVTDSDIVDIEAHSESIKDQEMETVINKSYHADEIIDQIEKDSEPSTSAKDTEIDYDFVDEKEKRKAEILAQAKVDRPSLRGGPDMLIDLDSGDFVSKKKTGAEILLQRFNKCTMKKHHSKADLAILSVDHGVPHVDHYIVKVDNDDEAKTKDPIPGAAYVKLKQTLREKIAIERKQELMKKLGVTEDQIGVEGKVFEESDIEESDLDDLERSLEDTDADGETEEEPEENDIMIKDKKRAKNDFLDEEAEVSGEEFQGEGEIGDNEREIEDSEGDSTETEEEEEVEDNDKTVKKGRILKAFEDSDDDDQERELEKVTFSIPSKVTELMDESSQPISLLWQDTESKVNGEDDLLGLCSGVFTTQGPEETQIKLFDPATQSCVDESQLIGLCSGQFTSQLPEVAAETTQIEPEIPTSPKNVLKGRMILESSDENDENPEKKEKRMKKKLKKRKKKNLEFSDDEDLEDDKEDLEQDQEDPEFEETIDDDLVEDVEEKYVDYDSEENEIEVVMTKNEKVKRANEFFEAEAELSDEDANLASDDEDEKDLDRYDIELGDEDEFDQEKLQDEVGRIHMRKMLEQDKKELQNIQDLLLEDEENDGVGRTRQFRWKNVDQSFALEGNRGENAEDLQEVNDEIENEEKWRKMRFEREQLLKEKGKDDSIDLSASILDRTGDDTSVTIMNNTLGKKITIVSSIKKTSEAINMKKDSPFLISKATAINQSSKASFLKRDAATLSRLAAITRVNPEIDGVTSVNVAGSGRNFVFATLSPAVQDKSGKRSLDVEEEIEATTPSQVAKKQKRNNGKENVKSKKRLLEQLN